MVPNPAAGQDFQAMSNTSKLDLFSIWGSSTSDVWVVGDLGEMLHYDGTAWTLVTDRGVADSSAGTGTGGGAAGPIWGSEEDDVWACNGSYLVHWDGAHWSTGIGSNAQMDPNGPAWVGSCTAMWGSAWDDIWLAAPGLWHYDGATWQLGKYADGTAIAVQTNAEGLWGSSASDVWAAGAVGIQHFDGQQWTTAHVSNLGVSPVTPTLLGINGASSMDVWAVGVNGYAAYFNGNDWVQEPVLPNGDNLLLSGAYPTSPGSVLVAAGAQGILSWNGSQTSPAWQPDPDGASLDLLAATSASDVWAGGSDGGNNPLRLRSSLQFGFVGHWDGGQWTAEETGTSQGIVGFWHPSTGVVWATASRGLVLRKGN